MVTQQQADKKIEQLRRLALKANIARDKLEDTLARMQKQRTWKEVCKLTDMDPRGDAGDWMC